MTSVDNDDDNVFVMTMILTFTVSIGWAEKQKRVDVCVGFLNDNKNKAEEMRQVVEEALMILMLLTAGIRKTRSSWLNCAFYEMMKLCTGSVWDTMRR